MKYCSIVQYPIPLKPILIYYITLKLKLCCIISYSNLLLHRRGFMLCIIILRSSLLFSVPFRYVLQ